MEDISRGVRSFTAGTAVSRVMGLVRESVFAHLFGVGAATDAFNVAFRVPNLLRDLFAETALSAAFVPVLTAEKAKGKEAQNRLASNIFNVFFVVTALFGGFLVGAGAAIATGCVVGNIMSGWPLMSVGMFLFGIAVILGNWTTTYLFMMGGRLAELPKTLRLMFKRSR